MKMLSQFRAVIIPDAVREKVKAQVDDITAFAGGCTKVEVRGEWEGVYEHGTRCEWWFLQNANTLDIASKVGVLCVAMIRHGEEAVMVYIDSGAVIFTRRDFPEHFAN